MAPAPVHKINDFKDANGDWRWNIVVTPGTPGGTPDDIVATSAEGYSNRKDMLNSLFGHFFATYDESFFELYREWNPEAGLQEVPSDQVVNGDVPGLTDANPNDNNVQS